MPAASRGRRRLLVLIVLLPLVVSSCSLSSGSGDSPAGRRPGHGPRIVPGGGHRYVAPRVGPAVARGALFGRVMRADGTAEPDASVTLYQPGDDDLASTTIKFTSLGLICALPTHGVCGAHRDATVGDDGQWYLTRPDVQERKPVALTASVDGDPASASTVVATGNAPDPQRVPDLVLWQPRLRIQPQGAGLRVTWPALGRLPHGGTVRYQVTATPTDPFGEAVVVASDLTGTSAVVPGWRTEDQPVDLTVTASSSDDDVSWTYTSPAVRTDDGPVPPSRNAGCAADRGGTLVPVLSPCSLTDGALFVNDQVRLPHECDVDRGAGCDPPTHHRLCVVLARPETVDLVVVRTPFDTAGASVSLSSDGRTFRYVGRLSQDDVEAGVYPAPVSPATSARLVCVEDAGFGFTGDDLGEVSVW